MIRDEMGSVDRVDGSVSRCFRWVAHLARPRTRSRISRSKRWEVHSMKNESEEVEIRADKVV